MNERNERNERTADRIAKLIAVDIGDRSGLGDMWGGLDDEMRAEIIREWTTLIIDQLALLETHNKSSVLFGTWIDAVSEKPPRRECFGEFWRSESVLVTDGKRRWLGYWQSWDGEEYEPEWKMVGPDGWQITGVTHWMPLPPLPIALLETHNNKDGETKHEQP